MNQMTGGAGKDHKDRVTILPAAISSGAVLTSNRCASNTKPTSARAPGRCPSATNRSSSEKQQP